MPRMPCQPSRHECPAKLPQGRHQADHRDDHPVSPAAYQANLCSHPGEREKRGRQEHGHHGRMGAPLQLRCVQFEPDQEHVQHHPQLGYSLEGGGHLPVRVHEQGRDQGVHRIRTNRAKHRWTEQDPGDHLPDHLRLAKPPEDSAQNEPKGDHRCDGAHHVQDHVCMAGPNGGRFRHRSRSRKSQGVGRQAFFHLSDQVEHQDAAYQQRGIPGSPAAPKRKGRTVVTASILDLGLTSVQMPYGVPPSIKAASTALSKSSGV